jgi:YesN/AraC family two-component response regulator
MNSPPTVLIVDDEAVTVMLLERRIRSGGFTICGEASTKEEAVEIAIKETPDFILMDIRLIGTYDGIEAAGEISAKMKSHIIFITGYSSGEVHRRAIELKPLAYLVKPYEMKELLSIMRRCISNEIHDS